jgi:hypothetical protein
MVCGKRVTEAVKRLLLLLLLLDDLLKTGCCR